MTGPEHYEAAESLLSGAEEEDEVTRADLVAQAQVHATLALAAATAVPVNKRTVAEMGEWFDVCINPRPPRGPAVAG